GLSAVLLAAFGLQQRSRDAPILDPGIFVQPAMIGIAILLCAVSIGYWAVLVYLPLFLAAAYGWSSEVAGIALLTATLPMLFLPPLGGRLPIVWDGGFTPRWRSRFWRPAMPPLRSR